MATDHRVLVQAWVPLVPAGEPTPTPDASPSPAPDGDGDGEDGNDDGRDGEGEAGDEVAVLLTDPILQTDRPSDRSERC